MPENLEEVDDQQAKLASWHIDVLIRNGYDTYWAGRIAAIPEINVWEAVQLHKDGCPQSLVEELLR